MKPWIIFGLFFGPLIGPFSKPVFIKKKYFGGGG